jgi:hypothetical protein
MIDDKESHIHLPLIMFTCTTLRYAILTSRKNNGVHRKPSKSKLQGVRPGHSNYCNYKNDGGKNTSCCAAMACNLLILSGVADTYTFLMNTWNILPKSHQQILYNKTPATVKNQIHQAEKPTAALVISVEAACVEHAIILDYLTSEVALEQPEIGSTDR